MPSLLIQNIGLLVSAGDPSRKLLRGKALAALPTLPDAFVLSENGRIVSYGPMSDSPQRADRMVDAGGGMLLPCWVDSHTHLVFAGSREGEFVDRIRGLSYEEIARRGGGIMNSARRLRQTSESELYEQAYSRLEEVMASGTGAIEIKSGYGLDPGSELKMLRVIRRLRDTAPIPIKATFLGAHTVPAEFRENRQGYIDLIVREMLPRIAAEGLADYIDVFCEKVAFSAGEMAFLLEQGERFGLRAKVHTNQFNCIGGIQAAVWHGALSVDHLEVVEPHEIDLLAAAPTIATLLPSASFFLKAPYPPAREMVDAGCAIALASDFNPGSSPSGRMPFVLSLACLYMGLLPEEAIQAATLNGAFALEWGHELGSIEAGKQARFILTHPIPSIAYLPYAFGSDLVKQVIF